MDVAFLALIALLAVLLAGMALGCAHLGGPRP